MKGRILFVLFLLLQQQSWAEPAPSIARSVPSKESVEQSLLPYWEQTVRHDPGTKLFERTEEPGVYRLQTTAIPYTGRVKILNIIVDVYKPVGFYDRQVAFGGVIETELMDAPKDMATNQRFSLKRWQHMGWFDYDAATSEWFQFSSWDQHFPIEKRRGDVVVPREPKSGI